MIDERKDKLGEQSEEQVNIQELLFRYLIHWPWFVTVSYTHLTLPTT